jgi:hypothetical protein
LGKKVGRAEADEEFAKSLLEAYRMRHQCLRLASDLFYADISAGRAAESSVSRLTRARQDLRSRYPGREGEGA